LGRFKNIRIETVFAGVLVTGLSAFVSEDRKLLLYAVRNTLYEIRFTLGRQKTAIYHHSRERER
jgi:hypothetical protein